MPKIKNVSGRDLIVPVLGGRLVVSGAVTEVDAEAVYGFTCQEPNWQPADASAKKAHEEATTTQPEPEAPIEKEND